MIKNLLKNIFCFVLACFLFQSSFGCRRSFVNDEELYRDTIKKTVEIRCFDTVEKMGFATGCVISENGLILTNKHVVMTDEDHYFQNIEVRFFDCDDFIVADVMRVSESEDLALIRIDRKTEEAFLVGNHVNRGEEVYTIGNPNGFGLSFLKGTVSAPERCVVYKGQEIKTTQVSIVINEGNSGGPLFNANGELIGLITFRLRNTSKEIIQGVSFALHFTSIQQFLRQ